MDHWQLIKTPKLSGFQNMETDLQLFRDFEKGKIPSTLRIYSWQPRCVSFGYSQKMHEILGWDTIKRPTGGGIVYHNEAEVTYSVITGVDNLPKGLIPAYLKISEAVMEGLRLLGIDAEIQPSPLAPLPKGEGKKQSVNYYCFETTEEYEIVCQGKKIVGSAQKRGRKALLQQGTIKNDILGVDFDEMAGAVVEGFRKKLGVNFSE